MAELLQMQVDGLVGRSLWQTTSLPPLVAHTHALIMKGLGSWTMVRALGQVRAKLSLGNLAKSVFEVKAWHMMAAQV